MELTDVQPFIDTAFYACVTGGIAFMVRFLGSLSKSINELNRQVGVVIEKMSDHDYRIKRLETKQDHMRRKYD